MEQDAVSQHPTDHELIRFARHMLPADRVLAIDDHLAACDECRTRAGVLGGASRAAMSLGGDLIALDTHLTDDELHDYVDGRCAADVRTRVARHLQECATCESAVDDLRRFAVSRAARRRFPYAAAAAAAVLVVLSAFAVALWIGRGSPGGGRALAGLDALPASEQARVRAALDAGVVDLPAPLTELMGGSERLMGAAAPQPFKVIAPLATVTPSDRPTFEWEPMPGAEAYTVVILTDTLEPVAGPGRVAATTWQPPEPLVRGRQYLWQVTAQRGGETVTVPAPPAPPARFRVMEAERAAALQEIAAREPDSHLILGILFTQAGARQEAERHFRLVPPDDPNAGVARRTLERLSTGGQAR